MTRGTRPLARFLSAAAVVDTVAAPLSVYANTSTNLAYRRQIIALSGVAPVTGGTAGKVTHTQFA